MEKADSPSSGPWSVPVAVDNITANGLHIEIDAPAKTRSEVLRLVKGLSTVHDLASLSAIFDLSRRGAKIHVTGHVRARVGQTCVVTLEPMESEVDEAVDTVFAPAPGESEPIRVGVELKVEQEPPEPLVGGTVDLGALATEFLVLGVDPYPRKAGAEFAPVKVGEDAAHPFAALEALKKRRGDGQS
jgi:uncharacterized metal-binding protein YceD (DUF177 family)